MKRNNLIALVVILVALVAGAVIFSGRIPLGNRVACTLEAKICPDGSAVGRTGPNCEFAPCPGETGDNIKVNFPKQNDEVGLPLTITGEARVFENVFGYRLLSGDGTKLLQGYGEAKAAEPGAFGAFSLTVNYADPKTTTGTLELVEFSAETGEESKTIRIPIRFAPVDAIEVEVYFSNSKKDPKALSCEKTYPVKRRIAKTPAVAAEALRELIRGITGPESELGYMTALNPTTELKSVVIEDGVARADFSESLQWNVGGSCRVMAIRSQIENTLKQFPTVKEVVISVNGQSEGILQP